MSSFAAEVVRIKIEPHPNADAIELARVGDYQSIVKKGQFKDGDLGVYIQEQTVVPDWMLKKLGLWDDAKNKGGLSGSLGNRVRAIKLRGILSQGLILPVLSSSVNGEMQYAIEVPAANETDFIDIQEGQDVAEALGLVKWEPAVPTHMRGRVVGVDFDATAKYDFDNLKKMPDMFEEGEPVVITEKIHGTLIQIGIVPDQLSNEKYYKGRVVISSKGMGAKGFVLDHNDETNLYAQAAKKYGLLDRILDEFGPVVNAGGAPVFVFGEVFGVTESGKGVQDLTYGNGVIQLRLFDIAVGNRGKEEYAPFDAFKSGCEVLRVESVPVLYEGPYSKEVVAALTDGKETISGTGAHIREGVVVKSATEAKHPKYGRKVAKSVSEAYLLRKGDVTEFN